MPRYAVRIMAELIIEVQATSPETAKLVIFEAFRSNRGYDPLAETRINLESARGFNAVLKTTRATERTWDYLEAEEV